MNPPAAVLHPDAPSRVAVVVPAHDEEDRIRKCLTSIEVARRRVEDCGVVTSLAVVLDDCGDRTGTLARVCIRATDAVVCHNAHNVGRSRQRGFDTASRLAGSAPWRQLWLATTDADTVVPPDWLARQVRWACRGADAVAGSVRVDSFAEHPAGTSTRYRQLVRRLRGREEHPHIHGANLGVRASALRAVGGVPPLRSGEDRALWEALGRAGFRRMSVNDFTVTTSGRAVGRAPEGFAELLRRLGDDVPTSSLVAHVPIGSAMP